MLTVPEKSSEKTIDTEAISCQNLDHSLEDKGEIKHELQEESNTDVCEVEDCNAKQEIGSENCDNSKVILLDNESEMTNELEEDNKNNDCDMDHCYPKLEGLYERDEDMNESSEKSNPILVERSDKAVPINQEPIYEKGNLILCFFNIKTTIHSYSQFVFHGHLLFCASLKFLEWSEPCWTKCSDFCRHCEVWTYGVRFTNSRSI